MTTRQEAVAQVALDLRREGITATVFDRPPSATEAPNPHVAVMLTSDDPTEFNMTVYVVTQASLPSAEAAYRDHLTLVQQVDEALDAAGYGPPSGNYSARSDLDAYVYQFDIQFPRDDF
jgi:hypothetical protein